MRITMKKLVSLLLCLALTFAMSSAFALDLGKYDEPITVTYLSTDRNVPSVAPYDESNPARKSARENTWIDGYLETLGIKLDRIIAEDATALNARINTGIASGDLPDIMLCSKEMFNVLCQNDVLADLTEAYENYEHKDFLNQIETSFPAVLDAGKYKGRLMGYAMCGNMYNASDVLWVRQDWLDKVGMDVPATLDETIEVARAFKEAKLGGEDTIGLGFHSGNGAAHIGWMLAAYGSVVNTWMEQEDGSYVYGNTMDEVKPALLKLQELYAEGLIRDDFAVGDTIREDVANGRCGLYVADVTRGVIEIQTNFNSDPEADWHPYLQPTLDGNPVKEWTNAQTNSFYCVRKGFEHPEALFMLIEFSNQMRFSADPELSARFNVCEDGYQMWSLDAFRDTVRADTDLYKGELIAEGLANNTPDNEMNALALSNYQLCKAAKYDGARQYQGRLVAFVEGYGVTIPLLAGGYLCGSYNGPLTENMTLYESSINEALTAAMVKVVMGEDISVYEDAVATWYANGGEAITEEVNDYYQSNK